MELQELQREVEHLNPEEQRKLISFLVSLDLRRDEAHRVELERRLDDRDPNGWIRLEDAERQLKLKTDGV